MKNGFIRNTLSIEDYISYRDMIQLIRLFSRFEYWPNGPCVCVCVGCWLRLFYWIFSIARVRVLEYEHPPGYIREFLLMSLFFVLICESE